MALSQESLQILLDKWQPRLGLMHWRIQVRCARHHEMDNAGRLAQIGFNARALRADILIQDPDDYRDDLSMFDHNGISVEASVVHELLHLVLVPISEWFSDEDAADNDLERTVRVLERALMER